MKPLMWAFITVATICACSDDISGPPAKRERIELLPEYIYLFQNEEKALVTSTDYFAILFQWYVSDQNIDRFLKEYNLEPERPISVIPDFYLVRSEEVFIVASDVSERADYVKYVGPVFEWLCNGEVYFTIPANQIIIRGDVSDKEVASWLRDADAKIISRREHDPTWYVYEIPWGDAADMFALTRKVHRHEAIQYASPNFLIRLCKYDVFGANQGLEL